MLVPFVVSATGAEGGTIAAPIETFSGKSGGFDSSGGVASGGNGEMSFDEMLALSMMVSAFVVYVCIIRVYNMYMRVSDARTSGAASLTSKNVTLCTYAKTFILLNSAAD